MQPDSAKSYEGIETGRSAQRSKGDLNCGDTAASVHRDKQIEKDWVRKIAAPRPSSDAGSPEGDGDHEGASLQRVGRVSVPGNKEEKCVASTYTAERGKNQAKRHERWAVIGLWYRGTVGGTVSAKM
ncbi:hypothetical protein NDU88_001049 [Pleurodeles waltl]|uniref:Uncharacterized protein n=1 Tax=Pleurodeles waltl TaxID=8319 RepID=A0AAV7URQ1_PLEWA|nr:hypothetical protein NDU88_001049 [Pleurodeles waltl]